MALLTSFARASATTTTATTASTTMTAQLRRCMSVFADVKQGPPDAILGLTVAFNADSDARKMNLGVGAYRDNAGKPFVLDCVRQAESRIAADQLDHEYAGITGVPAFTRAAAELLFGADSPALAEKRVVSTQSISGTGALRIGAEFLARFMAGRTVYLPTPTWANHTPIFRDSGCTLASYRYYNASTCGLDFDGMLADIDAAPAGSVILLHTCAHNPTGVDPSLEQWRALSDVIKRGNKFPLFDTAYQGFASGDPERDAAPVRMFIADGHEMITCQSFAKNFGLYGQRVGAMSLVTAEPATVPALDSQLKILVRPMYSNPPIHGARLVATVLGDDALQAHWRTEVKLMADRIIDMRAALVDGLRRAGSTRDWSHITSQIGMFTYTGLTTAQVDELRETYHIYMTKDGRISVAGVNTQNVDYLAQSIHAVTK